MKKFFIFLSFLFLVGCSPYRKITVLEKSYNSSQKEYMISEIAEYLELYKSQPIPIEEWMSYNFYEDDGYCIERIYQKKWDDKTEIVFILRTLVSDSLSYDLKINIRTRDKDY